MNAKDKVGFYIIFNDWPHYTYMCIRTKYFGHIVLAMHIVVN